MTPDEAILFLALLSYLLSSALLHELNLHLLVLHGLFRHLTFLDGFLVTLDERSRILRLFGEFHIQAIISQSSKKWHRVYCPSVTVLYVLLPASGSVLEV